MKRAILSCNTCRARKVRCDRNLPCHGCVVRGVTCEWSEAESTNSSIVPAPNAYADAVALANQVEQLKTVVAIFGQALNFPPDTAMPSTPEQALALLNRSHTPSLSPAPLDLPPSALIEEEDQKPNVTTVKEEDGLSDADGEYERMEEEEQEEEDEQKIWTPDFQEKGFDLHDYPALGVGSPNYSSAPLTPVDAYDETPFHMGPPPRGELARRGATY